MDNLEFEKLSLCLPSAMSILWFNNYFYLFCVTLCLSASFEASIIARCVVRVVSGFSDHDVAEAIPRKRMLATSGRQTIF